MPATLHPWYHEVLPNRVRQLVEALGQEPFEAWIAHAEDVETGKLMAWKEGRSRRHEVDVFEMLTFHYLGQSPSTAFDEGRVDAAASNLGEDVVEFWTALKEAARREARRSGGEDPLPGL